ncbi:MAG TPA: TIGR02996 domain-containing protein [Acetobacteraceae bacterium]|nr:TIGR02996 domain-containing protein [Acetobacteraceae bacterium]
MTEQAALRAVLDQPDDDAPRLAYAALMDRQDPPRGAFIRVQIAKAAASGTARVLKGIDEDLLLIPNQARWAAPVTRLADDWVFHRGFIEAATMTASAFLAHAPALYAVAPVRHLTLTDAKPKVRELFASPHLRRIRSLELDQNQLDDEDIARLAASPMLGDLRWLSLAWNGITMAGFEALAGSTMLPRLRYGNFVGNEVDPSEQIIEEQGYAVDTWMPPEGEWLEQRYGPLAWLHHSVADANDDTADRFTTA